MLGSVSALGTRKSRTSHPSILCTKVLDQFKVTLGQPLPFLHSWLLLASPTPRFLSHSPGSSPFQYLRLSSELCIECGAQDECHKRKSRDRLVRGPRHGMYLSCCDRLLRVRP